MIAVEYFDRTLPATLDAVDAVCVEVRESVIASLPLRERFAIELLLREALTNAVLHGARSEPAESVRCEVGCMPGGLVMRVSDGGEGFDARVQATLTAAAEAESGRGLEILRSYATWLSFNEKGNEVELIRLFEGPHAHRRPAPSRTPRRRRSH